MIGRLTWALCVVTALLQSATSLGLEKVWTQDVSTIPINLYFNWTMDITDPWDRHTQSRYRNSPPSPFDTYDRILFGETLQDEGLNTLSIRWQGTGIFVAGSVPPGMEYTTAYKDPEEASPPYDGPQIPSTSSKNVNEDYLYYITDTFYGQDYKGYNSVKLNVTRATNQSAEIRSITTTLGMKSDAYVSHDLSIDIYLLTTQSQVSRCSPFHLFVHKGRPCQRSCGRHIRVQSIPSLRWSGCC